MCVDIEHSRQSVTLDVLLDHILGCARDHARADTGHVALTGVRRTGRGWSPRRRPVQTTRTFKGTKRYAQSALTKFVSNIENGQGPLARGTTRSPASRTATSRTRSPCSNPAEYATSGTRAGMKSSDGRVRLTKLTAQQLDRTYSSWLAEELSPTPSTTATSCCPPRYTKPCGVALSQPA